MKQARAFDFGLLAMILIPIAVGLGFATLTIWSVTRLQMQESAFVATTGIVMALKPSPRFGDPAKSAYVAFTDRQGRSRTFLTRSRTNPSRYAVGQIVAVRYDPASHTIDLDATVDSFSEGWLDPIVTGVTACAFMVCGIGFLIVAWPRLTRPLRRRRRTPRSH
jgi:hypothetical protein